VQHSFLMTFSLLSCLHLWQVLAFDDEHCDQLFTSPVPKATPDYYKLIQHPISLKDIGCAENYCLTVMSTKACVPFHFKAHGL
jgi:Bromodomain